MVLFLPVAFPPAFGVVAFRVRLACRALLPHVLPLRRSACRVSLRCVRLGFARRARLPHAALCASLRFVYRALPSVCHASFRARLRGSPLWQLVAVGSGQRCVFVGAAPSTPFAAFGSTASRLSLPVRALAPSLVARFPPCAPLLLSTTARLRNRSPPALPLRQAFRQVGTAGARLITNSGGRVWRSRRAPRVSA